MDKSCFFLVYVSSAVELLTQAELLMLLEKCVDNNSDNKITGMLLYKDGNFMQVLEGDELVVRSTYEKILKDHRHHGLNILMQGFQAGRQFPDWSMGFHNLTFIDDGTYPGYVEFMSSSLRADEFFSNPGSAQRLLMSFKKNM